MALSHYEWQAWGHTNSTLIFNFKHTTLSRSDSIQRIERLLKSDKELKPDKFTATIISQCAHITRVSLLLAFIGKLIKEETDLKVITSGSISGIHGTIDSPAENQSCKFYFYSSKLIRGNIKEKKY